MAINIVMKTNGVNIGHCRPTPIYSRPQNVPSTQIHVPAAEATVSQEIQVKIGKGAKLHSQPYGPDWAGTQASQNATIFQSQVANIQPSAIEYPTNHLLGIPQEVRDAIVGLLFPAKQVIGARPSTGCEIFHFVCRQTYHESCRRRNTQATVLVPSNRAEEFLMRSLHINTIKSKSYQSVKGLFLEIRHNSHSNVFLQMADVLRRSTQLEELHLFGIGEDGYGVNTSSAAHPCGKHDISIMSPIRKLAIDGQQYQHRLALFNSIPWLERLRVLVLDNLNLPLLQAHVLKNKPRLEKLYIAADPRTVLHGECITRGCYTAGNLVFPVHEKAPPVKELHVDSNSILTASQITLRMASSLESLELVVPDMLFQVHTNRINFYHEASSLLHRLHIHAKQLRKLKVCVHGALSEESYHYANFMGALKDCVSRMQSLELIELHVNSQSPWFAREFIEAVPRSVTRLYLTDLFVDRDVLELLGFIGEKTRTPMFYSPEIDDAYAIGEHLQRKDYIQFSDNRLAFVGYEYDVFLGQSAADAQAKAMSKFLKLNGRMLDKERNRHLALLDGKHIPFKTGGIGEHAETVEAPSEAQWELSTRTKAKAAQYRKELVSCGLGDNEYFGNEDAAEAVFHKEPAAKGGYYSYPAVYQVEKEFKFSNHWLSK